MRAHRKLQLPLATCNYTDGGDKAAMPELVLGVHYRNMGKFLGIDYGTKRVGLALSDDTKRLAFPYATLENNKKLLENVMSVIKEHNVDAVVLGESVTYKRDRNPLMERIQDFKKSIEETAGLAVHLEPEWLTSVEARRTAPNPKLVDASAAALILQTYLDRASCENESAEHSTRR